MGSITAKQLIDNLLEGGTFQGGLTKDEYVRDLVRLADKLMVDEDYSQDRLYNILYDAIREIKWHGIKIPFRTVKPKESRESLFRKVDKGRAAVVRKIEKLTGKNFYDVKDLI